MPTKECSVETCQRPTKANGLCSPHDKRVRTTGDVRADEPIAHRRGWQTQPDQCIVATCEEPARRHCYCCTHSSRFRLHGDPLADVPIARKNIYDPICSVDGCERPHDMLGFCNMHAQRVKKNGDPGEVGCRRIYKDGSPCLVPDCERPVHTKGYCDVHYRRWYKHGDPLGGKPPKTQRPETLDGYKWCSRCELIKPLDGNFGYDKRTKDGRGHWCKRCITDAVLIKTYNITLDWYEKTFVEQGGGCKTCQIALDPLLRVSRLSVDHDHAHCPGPKSCGECVRGLLCSSCNHALGNVHDDVAILGRMIDYLNFHHARREAGYEGSDISHTNRD